VTGVDEARKHSAIGCGTSARTPGHWYEACRSRQLATVPRLEDRVRQADANDDDIRVWCIHAGTADQVPDCSLRLRNASRLLE